MRRRKTGSTVQQYAYARKRLNGEGSSKYEMAVNSGYAPATARNAAEKIESTEGYQNAIVELAQGSHELVTSLIAEYQNRGFVNFSNKDLNSAMNAIASAWERFDKRRSDGKNKDPNENPLRAAVIQRATTIINNPPVVAAREATASEAPSQEGVDLDF